jgi:sulfonate transport system substrate-binding protein
LQKSANLPADDAQAYAKLWGATYVTTFEPADIAMLKKMAEIFKQAGTLKNNVPDSAFVADPYIKAKARFSK